GGLQRRTALAKALLVGAELLLLDEPTSGLDPAARREFLGFLAELRAADGITIVLTTHDMEEAERCDRVAILDRGRLVALGAPEALRAQVGGDVLVVAGPDPARLAERVRARFGLAGRLVDGTLGLAAGRARGPRVAHRDRGRAGARRDDAGGGAGARLPGARAARRAPPRAARRARRRRRDGRGRLRAHEPGAADRVADGVDAGL